MKDTMQPLLTIGMIFKNEIRCLERCLKSLETLRQAIPCELIMADTGSDDGSREIAANYADILFDFPWRDDFSAARNAVMDRALGKWYLTIDADEYLDNDISELIGFLRSDGGHAEVVCSVVQRNYESYEMNGNYADFPAVRMLRMSTGLRYQGVIHEKWELTPEQSHRVRPLSGTILHHDGYAEPGSERDRAKCRRNLKLLGAMLDKNPKDLTALLQYVESSTKEPEHPDIVRRAVSAVEEKQEGWELFGATIYRHAVRAARERNLPELMEWVKKAEEKFPDSFFTRIDVEYLAFTYDWEEKNYASCICRGENYLKALSDYQRGRGDQAGLMYGPLMMGMPRWEQELKIFLANACLRTGDARRCIELLEGLDWTLLTRGQEENFVRVIRELHFVTREDTAPILTRFWDGIRRPDPDGDSARMRQEIFCQAALQAFTTQNRREEECQDHFCRPSYTLFLPLKDKCDIGRGAAILASEDAGEIARILAEVGEWEDFPPEALSHALSYGITFPLAEHPLKFEEMDTLAGRMASDKESFYDLLRRAAKQDFPGNLQKTAWLRGLALAAVQTFDWDADTEEDIDTGIELARLFARIEGTFIPDYYQPELLHKENLCLLPPLHRLGWYCAQAFKALDGGNTTEYIRSLHAGLNSCREGKAMIGFLTEHIPQLQRKEVSPELKDLAEQVRMILSAYPADAPEIRALKNSPVYQQVAWLIEG